MCSGCINDRNGLMGKVSAELSTLARLEVTPEGQACSHLAARLRTCGQDVPKSLSSACSPPKTQLLHHSREKQELALGRGRGPEAGMAMRPVMGR